MRLASSIHMHNSLPSFRIPVMHFLAIKVDLQNKTRLSSAEKEDFPLSVVQMH